MRIGYVDTSCLVAIAFGEAGHEDLARRLAAFDRLTTSNLTEAELLSTCRREQSALSEELLVGVDWVIPDRALTVEYEEVLERGYQKGADLSQLACALYLRKSVGEVTFMSVDQRQLTVAKALGM